MGLLGPSWGRLGAILGPSWAFLGPFFWAFLGHLGALLAPPWAFLGYLGALLGPLGALLGSSWGRLGAILGPSWAQLGAILSQLGPTYGHLEPSCGHLPASLLHDTLYKRKPMKNLSFFKVLKLRRRRPSSAEAAQILPPRPGFPPNPPSPLRFASGVRKLTTKTPSFAGLRPLLASRHLSSMKTGSDGKERTFKLSVFGKLTLSSMPL